ncbi:MAG: sigma-70 family RNA polymerase sigma factor [Dehalococcoidia bacterium]|nr:sigma-70 family RNA polymerase sigma factor [Dehalococcoidia bacterium]
MDQLADTSLVELAKAGDQHAFAELYNRYFDPVYDFVSRMTRNRDEAADIAQDTFLKAMNALGGLQKGASFKSWIFTIARNTALNRLEKASRIRPLTFEDNEGDEVSFDVVDTDRFSNPEEAAQAGAIASLVWEAATGLDPRQLSLLDLHLRQGLDSGEIADVLGVTKNNGYVMLNRLKKAVEEAIGAFIMFKTGRQYCESLDAALSKADIRGCRPKRASWSNATWRSAPAAKSARGSSLHWQRSRLSVP